MGVEFFRVLKRVVSYLKKKSCSSVVVCEIYELGNIMFPTGGYHYWTMNTKISWQTIIFLSFSVIPYFRFKDLFER